MQNDKVCDHIIGTEWCDGCTGSELRVSELLSGNYPIESIKEYCCDCGFKITKDFLLEALERTPRPEYGYRERTRAKVLASIEALTTINPQADAE